MKTHATASTSINCYHGIVQGNKQGQYDLIKSVMNAEDDYSMQELHALTGLQTSTLSPRLKEMRDMLHPMLKHAPKRRCSISGVTIEPHRLVVQRGQLALLS